MKASAPKLILNAALILLLAQHVIAQDIAAQAEPSLPPSTIDSAGALSLPLTEARRVEIEQALRAHDYRRAETILVEEINRNPRSASLLIFAAGIFFLDNQYLNAAIAYKKAERIAPLDERSRFTLAMAYIKLGRRDWARLELEKLTNVAANNPLYHYWLGRLDYDAHRYAAAVGKYKKEIELDPQFMKAYDNLGLCYEFLGRYDEAAKSYREAIRLNRLQKPGSPWPPLNFSLLLTEQGKLAEAEAHLKEALQYDPKFARAHFQRGVLYDKQRKYQEAVQSLTEATACDPSYPEPWYLLGKIYHRLGEREKSHAALDAYQKLKREKRHEPPRP